MEVSLSVTHNPGVIYSKPPCVKSGITSPMPPTLVSDDSPFSVVPF